MSNTTDSANAAVAALPLAPCSGPTAEEIEHARKYVQKTGAKLRKDGKMMINTTTMTTRVWPTIGIWDAKRRRYFPLQIGTTWRYERSRDRDRVLAAITSPNTPGLTRRANDDAP